MASIPIGPALVDGPRQRENVGRRICNAVDSGPLPAIIADGMFSALVVRSGSSLATVLDELWSKWIALDGDHMDAVIV